MIKLFKRIGSAIGTGARAFVVLIGIAGIGVATANYAVTVGSGTTFGSVVVSAVHYAQQLICDPATPSQCAAVSSGGAVSTADAAVLSAINSAVPAGTNLIGDVNLRQGGTALSATNPIFNAEVPTTAGGLSVYFVQPTASDNHVVIKAGAGQVYKVSVTNNSATVNYLRLYNATTGFNGCNSATNLVYQMAIPASTTVGGLADSWDKGIAFSTGISICVTSGYATTDTTNATATAMSVNVGYK